MLHIIKETRDKMILKRNTLLTTIPVIIGILAWLIIEYTGFTGPGLLVLQLILFFSIILVIWQGSNLLVDSSQEIARHFKVSPFLIGLTVVAFGTSVPELVTSLVAGVGGKGDIAIANIVGSNILNISVILGGLAFLTKGGLAIQRQTIKLDAPILIFGALLILLFIGKLPDDIQVFEGLKTFGLLNLKLDFFEAVALSVIFGLYLYIIISRRKKTDESLDSVEEDATTLSSQAIGKNSDKVESPDALLPKVFRVVAGLVLVMLGCHVLVGEVQIVDSVIKGYGAVWFASVWGVPDFIVGLSIVALGTSAPEIVVSLSAVRSNAVDVGVGNLLGSAIFNIFVVLGLAGMFVQPPLAEPITISAGVIQSLFVMGLLFIVLFIFLATSQRLSRKEGFVLLGTGVSYMIYEMLVNLARHS